jgi:hypothetical protein
MRPTATPPSLPRTPDTEPDPPGGHLSAGSAASLHEVTRVSVNYNLSCALKSKSNKLKAGWKNCHIKHFYQS